MARERSDVRDAIRTGSLRTRHTAVGLVGGAFLTSWLALGCEANGGSTPQRPSGAAGGASGAASHGGAAGVGTGASASADSALLPARIRRLTNAEYDASVQALLGTTATPSVTFAFPPDSRQGPTNSPAGAAFTVNDAQRVDPVLADKLDAAAQALVAEARMKGKLAALAPCADPTLQGEQCAQTFLRSFGRSAYRRPLSDEEVTFLTAGPGAAYHVGADGYAYEDGIGLLLRVLLQQPAFLYTTELGIGDAATFELTQDEIATALSYLLTSAPPDEALKQRAAAGELASPELREGEAKRLLASAAGRARLVRVVQEWLGIDQVARREKAASVYPQFANIAQAFEDESRAFIDEVLNHSTGTLSELLTADFTMADAAVAEFYGVPWGGAGQRTSLKSVKRRGILNQGAFLSVFASNNGSHPVFRGVALTRRVACLDTPDPGALGIVVSLPAADPQKTTRERFQVHTTDPGCAGCHTTIDAFGFTLESFDGIGQWRTSENGRPVDTTLTLGSGSELDGTYEGSSDLLAALARSNAVKSCLARQLFRTSAARSDASVGDAEQAFVDVWQQLPASEQDRLADVLVAFVKSPSFIRRMIALTRPFVRAPRPRSATRRSFLRAVGAGATLLPFYQLLEDSVAQAAGEASPLKLIVISHPHGIANEYFAMRTPDAPDIAVEALSMRGTDTASSFDIAYPNCSLRPFDDAATYGKSFKDRLLLIEGLDLASDGHDAAASILTGSPLTGGKPGNSSLDQYLSVEMGLGASTRKSNVVLGVGEPNPYPGSTLSYSAGGAGMSKIISPYEAFDYLFSGFVAPDDSAGRAALARRNALGQSVVDAVRADCNRLRARLAPVEQQKMDQHLAAIRDLEKSFDSMSGSACSMPPSRPAAGEFPSEIGKLMRFNGGEPTFDAVSNYFVDLLAQAFACDVTRFGTLVLNDLPWDVASNAATDSLGIGLPSDIHNLVAHKYTTRAFDWEGKLSGKGDAATWLPLAKYNAYVYGKVARLMQRLDALGALDNVLIYVTSELGNPNSHSSVNVPTVLAGGANVPFRFGRRLQMSPDCLTPNDSCTPRDAKYASGANNHLLVSIAQAFGVEVDSFGQGAAAAYTTGALAGLT